MNNLKTKVAVNCSYKGSVSPYNGKVISILGEIIIGKNVKIDVKYYDEEGNFLTREWLTLDETKSNEIINLIGPSVIDNHKKKITETFGITSSNIEEVN